MFLRCISVAPYLPRLSDSDFQNECFSIFFSSVGARAHVSFFLPNFDVIRTKEAEMELVHIACFGCGKTNRVLEFVEFLRVLQFVHFLKSFSSSSFYGKSCYRCLS